MRTRDHSVTCDICGLERGGMNDLRCDCQDYGGAFDDYSIAAIRNALVNRRTLRETAVTPEAYDRLHVIERSLIADIPRMLCEIEDARAAIGALNTEVQRLRDALLTARHPIAVAASYVDDTSIMFGLGVHAESCVAALRVVDAAIDPPVAVDDPSRCAVCGWGMLVGDSCTPGDCLMRPLPEKLYAPERAAREAL